MSKIDTSKVSLKLTSRINFGRRGARAHRVLDLGHSPQALPQVKKKRPQIAIHKCLKSKPQKKCHWSLPAGKTSESEARARAELSILDTAHKSSHSLERVKSYIKAQRYSQGKTGVSLNSVQEWLVGCSWSFWYVYT